MTELANTGRDPYRDKRGKLVASSLGYLTMHVRDWAAQNPEGPSLSKSPIRVSAMVYVLRKLSRPRHATSCRDGGIQMHALERDASKANVMLRPYTNNFTYPRLNGTIMRHAPSP